MTNRTIFALSVIGRMNPAIHHPSWYGRVGILTEDEVGEALGEKDSPELAVQVQASVASFTFGQFSISCTPESWNIQCEAPENPPERRAIEVAGKTFTCLDHTPVDGFSVTSAHHVGVSVPDVALRIANLLKESPLGLGWGKDESPLATYQLRRKSAVAEHHTVIEPSVRVPGAVFMLFRSTFPIPAGSDMFDLKPLLLGGLKAHKMDFENQLTSILQVIDRN